MPGAVQRLLPRLRDPAFTRVLLVTLPEATPVHEAAGLQADLERAGIRPFGWIINQSLTPLALTNTVLRSRQANEHRYIEEVRDCFGIPGVPNRIESRLADAIKRSLNELRSVSRYTERDRVIALSGLMTAKVLGVSLPRLANGNTPFEEYDQIMANHGRRPEFSDG